MPASREITLSEAEYFYNTLPKSYRIPSLSPRYIAIDSTRSDGVGKFWVYEENACFLLYGFMQTPIALERESLGDIQSPYGYGNPVSNSKKIDFWKRAKNEFINWASRNNLIVEFVRAHPLAVGPHSVWASGESNRTVCSVDLSADILGECKPRIRSKIRKALRENDLELVRATWDNYKSFYLAYIKNIREIGAKQSYEFPEEYFAAIAKEDISEIFYLKLEGYYVAGVVILRSDESGIAEYHLGWSRRDRLSVNWLLICLYMVSRFYQKKNYSELYLGGGRTTNADDSLLLFKEGIGSIKRQFNIYYNVAMPEAYQKMKERYPREAANGRVIFYRDGL